MVGSGGSALGSLLRLQPPRQPGTGTVRFTDFALRFIPLAMLGGEGINPGTAASVGLQAAAPGARNMGLTC